jgi:hypothetical protein
MEVHRGPDRAHASLYLLGDRVKRHPILEQPLGIPDADGLEERNDRDRLSWGLFCLPASAPYGYLFRGTVRASPEATPSPSAAPSNVSGRVEPD